MMVMMPVMVMMVVSVIALGVVDGAVVLVAMLARGFELESCVGDTVLGKFFADGVLDAVSIAIGNYVQGCIIVVAVHAPHVHVVNVLYTINMRKVLANFVDFDAVGCFFEEEIDGFL